MSASSDLSVCLSHSERSIAMVGNILYKGGV